MFPTVLLILNVSSVAVLWFGGQRVDQGLMEVGALTAFLAYLLQILMAVMMATFMLVLVPRASVCADRIAEVLDTASSVVPPQEPVRAFAEPVGVELRGVELTHPGASDPVLRDVSLVVRPGETTAVVGSTGAGKTTLVNLVPRLLDVTGGAVLVGGVDVRDLDPDVLHGALGLVPQRAFLFSGTVASNLRYGRADATDDELWDALEIAQAREFVAAMPEGLDAPDHPGRHQPVRRPAPAPRHRPGRRAAAGRLPARRRVLRPRPRDRRPAAGGAAADHAERRRARRRAARLEHPRRRRRSSCSTAARSSAAAPTSSCSRRCPTYQEIVASQLTVQGVA